MTPTETRTVVAEALAMALEKMAFLDAMPSAAPFEPTAEMLGAEIDFDGPARGTLQIAAAGAFACVIRGTIAGPDDPGASELTDTLQELANVTCGLVLPMLATDETDVFRVSVPRPCSSADWARNADAEPAIMDVEGHQVAVRLILTNTNL